MKKILLLVVLFGYVSASFSQKQPVPLGELQSFWRNQPVLGPYHQEGQGLTNVPDYLSGTDFPYKKRPFENEAFFADHLSVVRLLGGHARIPGFDPVREKVGINEDGTMKKARFDVTDTASIRILSQLDFAYRKSDGTLGFRPDLIKKKLYPYISNGYTSFTIVLDDIPWCLTQHPVVGGFGQVAPADNPEEWYATIRELCVTLKDILGEEDASKLRFRIGTEMNGRERFGGTEYQFITHFDYASAAIAEVLPSCELGLFNISSASMENISEEHNVGAFRILEHSSTGINRRTGKPNFVKRPFVAASRYYYEKDDLDLIVSGIDEVWDYIRDSIPGYENLTREIHEFGAIADWNAVPRTSNPGAFGNAMNLQVVINLLSNGLDRLFHWGLLETVPGTSGKDALVFPTSFVWGYSVLDYMAGGKGYQIFPEERNANNKTRHTSLLSVFNKKAYLLVSAFNPDRCSHNNSTAVLKIPKKVFPFEISKLKSTSINNSNSIHYNILMDIEKEGILSPLLHDKPEYIPGIINMTSDANRAVSIIRENWDNYMDLWKNSLTLGDFAGIMTEDADFYTISLDMTTPESTVIVLSEQ
jgi:hypothetical protein